MCGRYRRTTQEEELAWLYHFSIPRQTDLPISYNIVPSQKVLTIRFNPETRARSLDALQRGLIPYWAKDQKIAYRTINARAETVDKAPSFRQAFRKRRCLIPADGFYEWRKTAARRFCSKIWRGFGTDLRLPRDGYEANTRDEAHAAKPSLHQLQPQGHKMA
jgi:putative SOS response-associated peptidase YedK